LPSREPYGKITHQTIPECEIGDSYSAVSIPILDNEEIVVKTQVSVEEIDLTIEEDQELFLETVNSPNKMMG